LLQLAEGFAAGDLNLGQDLVGFFRLLFQNATGGASLYAHDTHMVRHDVVKLPGDAHPLVKHGAAGVLIALLFKLYRSLAQFKLALSADAEDIANPPSGTEKEYI
jgi:hypothetical protein